LIFDYVEFLLLLYLIVLFHRLSVSWEKA
jgi:hypothetical protein